ncbi:type II secretion system protein [Candidatus Babeliales bacterium]|nr:type II secretion system protein [Candidatus Babeliales bacterium]
MSNTKGFSLLEIIVAIALLAFATSIVVPALRQRRVTYQRDDLVINLNALMKLGWEQAIITGKVHRVWFNLGKNLIEIQVQQDKNSGQDKSFIRIDSEYLRPSYEWAQSLQLKDFFIEGEDELHKHHQTDEVWFFITPDGLTQNVSLNIFDTQDTQQSDAGAGFSLILNPFTAQFSVQSSFYYP